MTVAASSAALRLRQGVRALVAFARPVDWSRAATVLSPEELALFRRMRRSEQLHSLRVLEDTQLDPSPVLDKAALLHDVGKSCYPIRLWQRALPVVVGAISPRLMHSLAERDPRPAWSRGFVVHEHHAEWGADLVAGAGSPESVVWLVRHHGDDPARWATHALYPYLVRLKAADDAN